MSEEEIIRIFATFEFRNRNKTDECANMETLLVLLTFLLFGPVSGSPVLTQRRRGLVG